MTDYDTRQKGFLATEAMVAIVLMVMLVAAYVQLGVGVARVRDHQVTERTLHLAAASQMDTCGSGNSRAGGVAGLSLRAVRPGEFPHGSRGAGLPLGAAEPQDAERLGGTVRPEDGRESSRAVQARGAVRAGGSRRHAGDYPCAQERRPVFCEFLVRRGRAIW